MLALDQVVLRAELQGLPPELVAVHAGEHHDRDGRVRGAHQPYGFQPLGVRQRQVEHDAAHVAAASRAVASPAVARCTISSSRQLLAQLAADQEGVVRVVLDQEQDARCTGARKGYRIAIRDGT